MKLRIMTWNIKGEASLGWNNQYEINSKVVDKIINQKADIIVLTAFVIAKGIEYLFERFQNEGYIWFISNCSGKNGVLIAIKKDLVNVKELINDVYTSSVILSTNEGCNILKVTAPMNCDVNISILGCRMETGGEKNLQVQYDSERQCFDNILIPKIQPLKQGNVYIVCGDFNNARCCGNLKEKFNPQDYNEKAQINYNLNIIRDTFDSIGFTMMDIGKKGESIPTHKGFYPLDHIFVYGLEPKECCIVPSDDLSDHDILIADCLLFQKRDIQS